MKEELTPAQRIARMQDRHELAQLQLRWKMEREQNQRDRGIGYLIWVARQYRRMGQRSLSRRMGTSRAALSRWENRHQTPNMFTLQRWPRRPTSSS